MNADLLALLDHLDETRAAATPGDWYRARHIHVFSESERRPGIGQMYMPADAALIVAAVNALPKLTAALRGCLRWADQLDREALALGAMQHDLHKAEAAQKRDAAAGIRSEITHNLGGAA